MQINMSMIIKNVKHVELNTKIASVKINIVNVKIFTVT